MLKSWTGPFMQSFEGEERVELVHLHLTEGWFSARVLKPVIARIVKNNTPEEQHETTLICFRKDLEEFRDALRIHNVMSGYVFLLDGLGRVRFAGSGEASPEEVEKLIDFADELTPLISRTKNKSKSPRLKTKIVQQ